MESEVKKVLVIGSINLDQIINMDSLPLNGETIYANTKQAFVGGKGANQAAAISKMGSKVSFIGKVGKDDAGKNAIKYLKKYKVDTSNILIDEKQPTGFASIYVQNNGMNSIVILKGANGQLTKKDIIDHKDLIKNSDIILTQFEIPLETVDKALKIAKEYKKITILNPAPAKNIPISILQNLDFIIPNETELLKITNNNSIENDEDIFNAMKKLNQYVPNIIVTYGSKGVYYLNNNKLKHFNSIKNINVVDTTAAGDSFIGGFVSQIICGKSIDEAINFGIKVASITIQHNGSISSIPYLKEIK